MIVVNKNKHDNRFQVGQTLRVAIAGLGNQGKEHLRASLELLKKGMIEFTAACDSNPSVFPAIPSKFKIPCYTSYEEMVEKENFDLLIVALPHSLHYTVVKDALNRGINVFKEKPFALSLKESQELVELALKRGCHLKVAQQRAFHPHYFKAKEFLKQIGKVRYLDYFFSLNDSSNSWYWSQQNGGGSWHGLGWHGCWALCFFMGLPEMVKLHCISGKERNNSYDTDDTSMLVCKFKSNTIGRIFVSVLHPFKKESFFVEGAMGSMLLNRQCLQLYDRNGKLLVNDNNIYKWEHSYVTQLKKVVEEFNSREPVIDYLSWEAMVMHDASIRSLGDTLGGVSITRNNSFNVRKADEKILETI